MLIILFLLLMLRVGRCTENLIFETKTVGVGDNVTLTCTRQTSALDQETLFWIRLVSGDLPDVLGGTFSFDYDGVNNTPRITAKQEPGTFVLHISQTKLSDSGVYYCVKIKELDMTFLNGTFLRVKGPEPDITAVVQVHRGDPVTLQCSVLSDSEKKTCPGDHSVYWFRAGSDKSYPSVIYTHGNSGDECEKSPEAHSPQKCVYNFSKNVSSADAGTYYCAVATCGEILFGNGTKLDTEVDSQKENTILYLVCAALAINLIIIAFLVYVVVRKSCDCCNAVTPQTNAATANDGQKIQQTNEDSLFYSTPNFTRRKAGKAGRRNATAKEETIYTDVRAFVI